MGFAELKSEIAGLSATDRLKLSAYLAELEDQNESTFREEVDRRMKAMDSGAKITMEEFERRHHELNRENQ